MHIQQNKKYIVKIPDKINLFYCETKKIIIIKGPQTQRSLKLETKIKITECFYGNHQGKYSITALTCKL